MAMATVHYWADELMLGGNSLPDTLPTSLHTAVADYIELIKTNEAPGAPYLKVHEGHGLFLRPDEAHILNRDLMERGCFVGTPSVSLMLLPIKVSVSLLRMWRQNSRCLPFLSC